MAFEPLSANGSLRRKLIWMEMLQSIRLDLSLKVIDKFKLTTVRLIHQ